MAVMLEDAGGTDESKNSAASGVGGWPGLERPDHRVKTLATSRASDVSTASALCCEFRPDSNTP